MTVLNKYGNELDFDSVVQFMDDDLREYLHGELAPCEPQVFYDEYCKMHKEKFGETFFTEDDNITW